MSLPNRLAQALLDNHYGVSPEAQARLVLFLELLRKWNKVFNLTSISSEEEMIYLHILDSLAALPYLHGTYCLDVGSGGGLPGIPLAILDPSKTWVLLDKVEKKTRFLVQAVTELGLKNVKVVASRCEDYVASPLFDTIISRAFASLPLFTETTQHLLAPQGKFLAMKGLYPHDEIALLGEKFIVGDVHKLDINGLQVQRHLIRIEKKGD